MASALTDKAATSRFDEHAPFTTEDELALHNLDQALKHQRRIHTYNHQHQQQQHQHKHASSVLSDGARVRVLSEAMCSHMSLSAEEGSAAASEDLHNGRVFINALKRQKLHLDTVLQNLHVVFEGVSKMTDLYDSVSQSTNEIRDACHNLKAQENERIQQADELSHILSYFQEEGRMAHRLSQRSHPIKSEEWKSIILRIDECIQYMRTHLEFRDARQYLARFQVLRTNALQKIVQSVESALNTAAKNSMSHRAEHSNGLANTLVEFRTASQAIRPIVAIIEDKANTEAEFRGVLHQCHQILYSVRHSVNYEDALKQFRDLASTLSLPAFTRSSCLYLIRFCSMELRIFQELFAGSSDSKTIKDLCANLCNLFYMQTRPLIIHESDIDALCDVAHILQSEILQDQILPRGEEVSSIVPVLERTVEDVEERLAYRAQVYIRDEIASYQFTSDDIDYPNLLLNQDEADEKDLLDMEAEGSGQIGVLWYPTLERTLVCLSKLYRCLQKHVFEYVAQESVSSCLYSLHFASNAIAEQHGSTDAQLFLIKHMLILREQLSPFDVDFAITESQLDFSHLTESFRGLLTGSSSVMSFLQAPSLLARQKDSKKDMELELKTCCQTFINHSTTQLCGSIVAFLSKASQPEEAQHSAFGSIDTMREMVVVVINATCDGFESNYNNLRSILSLYLSNEVTESIVLQPINSNISVALQQLCEFVQLNFPEDNIELESIRDLQHVLRD